MHVEEDERKGNGQSNPEDDQSQDQAHQCGYGREVAKGFGTEEARKRILFHRAEAVFFLRVKEIRDLCQHTKLGLIPRLVLTVEGESVYAEGRREVYLVVLLVHSIAYGRQIAVVDAFRRGDEIHAGDGG